MTSLDNPTVLARQFAEQGYLIFENFYDFDSEVRPIQDGIRDIIELVAKRHSLTVPVSSAEDAMTAGYRKLIEANRSYGGEVYDAIKQLPAFIQLISARHNVELFKALRAGSVPGLAGNGHGIRIDNPGDNKFRAQWHQEFINQLRSLDGVVFWSPLRAVTAELGPVELCPGSHRAGPLPVFQSDGGAGRGGAYSWFIDNEPALLKKYERVAPLTKPGDLLVMDFLTLHASGENVSKHPRWSMQWRYFNFAESTGMKIGWKGSFASGTQFQDFFPDLVAAKVEQR